MQTANKFLVRLLLQKIQKSYHEMCDFDRSVTFSSVKKLRPQVKAHLEHFHSDINLWMLPQTRRILQRYSLRGFTHPSKLSECSTLGPCADIIMRGPQYEDFPFGFQESPEHTFTTVTYQWWHGRCKMIQCCLPRFSGHQYDHSCWCLVNGHSHETRC